MRRMRGRQGIKSANVSTSSSTLADTWRGVIAWLHSLYTIPQPQGLGAAPCVDPTSRRGGCGTKGPRTPLYPSHASTTIPHKIVVPLAPWPHPVSAVGACQGPCRAQPRQQQPQPVDDRTALQQRLALRGGGETKYPQTVLCCVVKSCNFGKADRLTRGGRQGRKATGRVRSTCMWPAGSCRTPWQDSWLARNRTTRPAGAVLHEPTGLPHWTPRRGARWYTQIHVGRDGHSDQAGGPSPTTQHHLNFVPL